MFFLKAFDPNMLVRYYFNATTWMIKDIFIHWMMAKKNLIATKNIKLLNFFFLQLYYS